MDTIILRGMSFYGYHGVLPEETRTGQRFNVNVWLTCDLRPAGESDDVEKTIDYARVYEVVKEVVEGAPKQLIEAVAETIAASLFERFLRLEHVRVEVEKPGAPIHGIFEVASVQIERSRP